MIREAQIMHLKTTLESSNYLICYTILALQFWHLNPIAILLVIWIFLVVFLILFSVILWILFVYFSRVDNVDYFISTL